MKDKLLTTSSLISAMLSSLCCIGPLFLVGLGIGSSSLFLEFNSLRPYLIGTAFIFLIPAFYLVYKKREINCEDGSCKSKNSGKWNKIAVWLAAFIVLFFIASPYLGFDTSAAINEKTPDNYTRLQIKISNMDCPACARGLESQLKDIKGVKYARIYFSKESGIIKYDPSVINKQLIIYSLEAEGFPSKEIQ